MAYLRAFISHLFSNSNKSGVELNEVSLVQRTVEPIRALYTTPDSVYTAGCLHEDFYTVGASYGNACNYEESLIGALFD